MNTSELINNFSSGISTALSVPSESALFYLLSDAGTLLGDPLILIVKNDSEARRIRDELTSFFGCPILWYPKSQLTFHDLEAESSDIRAFRMKVINAVLNNEKVIIITTPDGLITPLSPPESIKKISVSIGSEIDTAELADAAVTMGYESVSIVDGKGQFSIRGGIIDFFPPYMEAPVRIELFDSEVDSIRTFDVISQRSLEKVRKADIMPASEIVISADEARMLLEKISVDLKKAEKVLSPNAKAKLRERAANVSARLDGGAASGILKNYVSFLYERRYTILDYCRDAKLVIFEPDQLFSDYENSVKGMTMRFTDMLENGEVFPSQIALIPTVDDITAVFDSVTWLGVKEFLSQYRFIQPKALDSIEAKPIKQYFGNFEELLADIIAERKENREIFLFTGNDKRALLLKEFFNDRGIYPVIVSSLFEAKESGKASDTKTLWIIRSHLSAGCIYENAMLVGDQEIFGTVKKSTHSKPNKNPIKSFTDLTIGSYVVHETHGIARFLGIETKEVSGKIQDYLSLEYAGGDKIFVPVDRLDFIQPYISTDGDSPQLSRLGGREWGNAKEKASVSIKKLAYDLVELYARREVFKGFRFSPDTVWQRELEESFIYEETDDQLRAIEEIKKDMEDYKIMDRLLCGDVGFGKTEVAVRAAFKAVMDGKQVAVLAPTTILVHQHFQTFSERYANFPVKVDVISRFRTPSEQKKTLEKLEAGEVDVLIGTHRLLSNDVHFKDLGLLIIDEEQRFGVNHKEKIKNMKKSVDVLTLSATPIPRTLHMSLVGIRDISVIETPPKDRFPVQTYVIEDDDAIIRDAILRELERDGQVFFLYNNVSDIDRFKLKLQELVPEARIGVGHGQMSESQLEKVMMNYFNHEYDILLCSTIIESGLDIPNANTLFVWDADKFGLSQLYQIRGRIGRSTRIAYAYLIYKRDKVLSDIATKRLKTLKEFTDLGSGFRIAMRDLEIRGAGNVIGSEQSGHMSNIGYDLYCKMLSDEVAKLKGQTTDDPIEVTITIDDDAYIPSSYIPEETVRLEMYKKISLITSREEKYAIEEEIEDRYSNMPGEIYALTNVAYLRAICRDAKITRLKQKNDSFELVFIKEGFDPQSFGEIRSDRKVKLDLNLKFEPKLTITMKDTRPNRRLDELVEIFEELFECKRKKEEDNEKV